MRRNDPENANSKVTWRAGHHQGNVFSVPEALPAQVRADRVEERRRRRPAEVGAHLAELITITLTGSLGPRPNSDSRVELPAKTTLTVTQAEAFFQTVRANVRTECFSAGDYASPKSYNCTVVDSVKYEAFNHWHGMQNSTTPELQASTDIFWSHIADWPDCEAAVPDPEARPPDLR